MSPADSSAARESSASVEGKDFRLFLQAEFIARCRRKPNYNLAAFGRFLEMDASTLSKILKGLRPIRAQAIRRIGPKLGLTPYEMQRFTENSPRINARGNRAPRDIVDSRFNQISLDAFQMIADWQHYAILELMQLPNFRPDYVWIGRKLDFSATEIMIAVERLVRLEMIAIDEDGTWRDISGGYTTTLGNDFTAEAFKRLQRQILLKAIEALDTVPLEARSQTSTTMAICAERLPEARKMIVEFQRKLNTFLTEVPKSDLKDVYQLSISLFPATRGTRGAS